MKRSMWDTHFHLLTAGTFFLILISAVLWYIGDVSWGRENGPIENFQVVLLLFGALTAYEASRKASQIEGRDIWRCGVVVFLIAVARELSWGRCFYPVGPNTFIPLKELWYGHYVYPILAAVLMTITVVLIWRRLDRYILERRIPLWDTVLFILLYIITDAAEHQRLAPVFVLPKAMLIEELSEMICYWCMIVITWRMGIRRRS